MTTEEHLRVIHLAVGRAMFLIVIQLLHKKLKRSDLIELIEKLEFAIAETKRLLNTKKLTKK
jgi:hypothetical protein